MLALVFPHGGDLAGSPYTWTWDASILIGIAVWLLAYTWITGPLRKRGGWERVSLAQRISFYSGTLVLFIALVSPLDHLGDEYLFSAHMIQHLLLMMVAPPLWLAGMPAGFVDRVISKPRTRRLTTLVTHPATAFLVFNAVMLAWHLPSLYQAALADERIHLVEHLMFIAAGVVGWWPVLGPSHRTAPRAAYPIQLGYLFAMMFPMTLLAALITFSKQIVYPFYLDAPRVWGLDVMSDQQVAGLTMWIPGNMIFFIGFATAFFKWFNGEEKSSASLRADS